MSNICSSVDVASLCIIDTSDDDDSDSEADDYLASIIREENVVGEGDNFIDDDEEKEGDTSSTIIKEKQYSAYYLKQKLARAKQKYDTATNTALDEIKKVKVTEYIKPIYHDEVSILHDLHQYCGGENGCKYIIYIYIYIYIYPIYIYHLHIYHRCASTTSHL